MSNSVNRRFLNELTKALSILIFFLFLQLFFSSFFIVQAEDVDLTDTSNYDAYFTKNSESIGIEGIVIGDVNGDDIDDYIISKWNDDPDGTAYAGSVWVIFGGSVLEGEQSIASSSNYNIRFDGIAEHMYLSRDGNLDIGDVNGDGEEDLIIGAHYADIGADNTGSVYVIYSTLIDDYNGTTGNNLSLSNSSNYNIRYDGAATGDFLRINEGSGIHDFDGDGKKDLIFGSFSDKVWLVSSTLIDDNTGTGNTIQLSNSSGYNIRIDAENSGDGLGRPIEVGDLNSDGAGDLILGAGNTDYNSQTDGGSAYVLFSTLLDDYVDSTGNTLDLGTGSNYNIRYDGINGLTDGGIVVGDVNGDNVNDLALGTPGGQSGYVWIMYSTLIDDSGSSTGNNYYLNTSSNYNVRYTGYNGSFGNDAEITRDKKLLIGDVNTDGYGDLVIGGPDYSVQNGTSRGDVWVIYSTLVDDNTGTGNNKSLTEFSSDYNVLYSGSTSSTRLPTNIFKVSDYNNDGNTDLILGGAFDEFWVVYASTLQSITGTTNKYNLDDVYDVKYSASNDPQGYHTGALVASSSDDIVISNGLDGEIYIIYGNSSPNAPSSLGPAGLVDGSYTGDDTPALTFDLTDTDDSDQVQYRIQIDNDSDFSSPVVDYESAFAAEGSRSFTVGQAAGSGSYTTGSSGQTLSGGSYYWQVKAIDDDSAESSYTQANSGSVAFIVDATAPTVPSDVAPSTTPTSDSTPTWTWTASSDGGIGLASTPYTVQWCTDSGFSGCSSNTATSSTTSFTHSTALADGTWYLRVKAADDAGNESAYSSNGSVVIDTASPSNFEIKDPDSKSYTSDERPEFVWTVDSSASTYDISIDNGDEGDFEITEISASGSGTTETNRYEVKYGDSKITFQTKSSSDWGDSDNDGELNEGEREVTITATDSSSNEAVLSQKFYVDRSGPSIEIETIGDDNYESGISLENNKPTIKIKAIDELNGENNGVASGPEKGEITVKRKGILGIYTKVKSESFDFDNLKWDDSGFDVSDNKKNDADKYSTYEFNFDEELNQGDYRIEINAEDKVGNSSDEEFSFTITQPVDLTVTTTPIPSSQDEQPTDDPVVDEEEQEESQERFYELDIKLFDKSGNPVSNANVNLAGTTYTTNQNGRVLVENVKEGSHVVRVNYNDFTGREEVVLSGDVKRQSVEIQMQIDSQVKNPVFRVISNVWHSIFNTLFGWISSIF